MKRVLPRILVIGGAVLGASWLADYLSFVYRIPGGREQYGTVQVQKVLAVPQKDHKTEYIADQPEAEQCVHSMFPHLGLTPCWYLARHANQQVNY